MTIARNGKRIESVTLKSGPVLGCGVMVNARGPMQVPSQRSPISICRCGRASASSTSSTAARRSKAARSSSRPEGNQYICGVSPDESEDEDCDDLDLDYRLWEDVVWPTIAHRVHAFEAVKLSSAWAEHYDYNLVDQNAILGSHPEVANLLFANGFSGHGIQQSPAAGRAIAELILYGRYKTLDLTDFAYERLPAGRCARSMSCKKSRF